MNDPRGSSQSIPSTTNQKKMFSEVSESGFSFKRRRRLLDIVVFCVLLLALAIPRFLALDRLVTPDERFWLDRSGRFYYALAHRNFAATYEKSHPGVTVMWAGLTGFVAVYPRYYEPREGQDRPVGLPALMRQELDMPLRILVAARQTMILLHLMALVFGFLYARRIFGLLPALIGFLLIAFDPFHIALSRVLHVDGLMADLALLSLLAFLAYMKEGDRTTLVVSAVAAGLAWLTKSPGLFLVPLIVLLAVFSPGRLKSTWGKLEWWKSILQSAKILVIWGVIAAFVFCLLWPAMWVNPVDSLVQMFTDAIGYARAGHESAVFFNGMIYPGGEIPDPRFYPISFLWRTTPVTLTGLLAAIVFLFLRKLIFPDNDLPYVDHKSPSEERNPLPGLNYQSWTVVALLLFAVGFGALMTLGLKKFDRYIIPCFVALDLVAGVGLVQLARWGASLFSKKWMVSIAGALLLCFVSLQAALAWGAFPYFFSYYNPLLGGARQAVEVMQIGWGEGLDQAADYINAKPNSNRIRVMAWYGGGPFSYFSESRVTALDLDRRWTTEDWDEFNKSDYVVVYIHQWQRDIPAEVLDQLRDSQPEYSVWIDGLEYIRVYKIN